MTKDWRDFATRFTLERSKSVYYFEDGICRKLYKGLEVAKYRTTKHSCTCAGFWKHGKCKHSSWLNCQPPSGTGTCPEWLQEIESFFGICPLLHLNLGVSMIEYRVDGPSGALVIFPGLPQVRIKIGNYDG